MRPSSSSAQGNEGRYFDINSFLQPTIGVTDSLYLRQRRPVRLALYRR